MFFCKASFGIIRWHFSGAFVNRVRLCGIFFGFYLQKSRKFQSRIKLFSFGKEQKMHDRKIFCHSVSNNELLLLANMWLAIATGGKKS